MSVVSGSRVGPYTVGDPVPSSVSGEWFVGLEPTLDRSVALCVLAVPADAEAAVELRDRARRLASLSDGRLLPIYGQGEQDDDVWIATRQLTGRSLRELGRLEPGRAARVIAQLEGQLSALAGSGLCPATIDSDQVLIEGDGPTEHAWLLPDLTRPVTADPTTATGSLAELIAPLTTSSTKRRPALFVGVGVLIAAGVALALTLILNSHHRAAPQRSAVIARVTARVPLGALVCSVVATGANVWVATDDGTLIRIDPRTNRVSGAPLRIMPPKSCPVVAKVGNEIWAAGPEIVRIDAVSGRVLGRRKRLGGVSLLTAGRTVWGTVFPSSPTAGSVARLVQLDQKLDISHRGPRLGGYPVIAAATADTAWAAIYNIGTLARVTASGRVTTVAVGIQTRHPVASGNRIWIPTRADRTVVSVDPQQMRIESVLHFDADPEWVTSGAGSIWVLTESPSRIYRIDPATSRILGPALPAPNGAYLLEYGAGALWVDDPKAKTLVRLTLAEPAPPPRPVIAHSGDLADGPIPAGKRLVAGFTPQFTIVAPDNGWLATGVPEGIGADIEAVKHPGVGLNFATLTRAFDASDRLVAVPSPADLLHVLRNKPGLRLSGVKRIRLDGAAGFTLRIQADPKPPYPPLCSGTQCVVVFPLNGGTYTLAKGIDDFTFVRRDGRLFLLDSDLGEHPDPSVVRRIRQLVASIRFGSG